MKRVLDVGNCDPDHSSIARFLTQHFEVEVDRAKLPADTLRALEARDYALVLVNRKLDEDYSDGVEIVRQIKANEATKDVPVMLITNYPEHQDAAEEAGALRGFGKLELNKPETRERVAVVLG